MIKSKKNTQKLYIELKASGKQVDKYFKRLNQYYPVPKTIKVLKAILEAVDTANSSTKESNVKLENVINQYIEIDQDFRGLNFAIISDAVGTMGEVEYFENKEEKVAFVKKISNQITRAKELIEYSDSGENVNDYLTVIK